MKSSYAASHTHRSQSNSRRGKKQDHSREGYSNLTKKNRPTKVSSTNEQSLNNTPNKSNLTQSCLLATEFRSVGGGTDLLKTEEMYISTGDSNTLKASFRSGNRPSELFQQPSSQESCNYENNTVNHQTAEFGRAATERSTNPHPAKPVSQFSYPVNHFAPAAADSVKHHLIPLTPLVPFTCSNGNNNISMQSIGLKNSLAAVDHVKHQSLAMSSHHGGPQMISPMYYYPFHYPVPYCPIHGVYPHHHPALQQTSNRSNDPFKISDLGPHHLRAQLCSHLNHETTLENTMQNIDTTGSLDNPTFQGHDFSIQERMDNLDSLNNYSKKARRTQKNDPIHSKASFTSISTLTNKTLNRNKILYNSNEGLDRSGSQDKQSLFHPQLEDNLFKKMVSESQSIEPESYNLFSDSQFENSKQSNPVTRLKKISYLKQEILSNPKFDEKQKQMLIDIIKEKQQEVVSSATLSSERFKKLSRLNKHKTLSPIPSANELVESVSQEQEKSALLTSEVVNEKSFTQQSENNYFGHQTDRFEHENPNLINYYYHQDTHPELETEEIANHLEGLKDSEIRLIETRTTEEGFHQESENWEATQHEQCFEDSPGERGGANNSILDIRGLSINSTDSSMNNQFRSSIRNEGHNITSKYEDVKEIIPEEEFEEEEDMGQYGVKIYSKPRAKSRKRPMKSYKKSRKPTSPLDDYISFLNSTSDAGCLDFERRKLSRGGLVRKLRDKYQETEEMDERELVLKAATKLGIQVEKILEHCGVNREDVRIEAFYRKKNTPADLSLKRLTASALKEIVYEEKNKRKPPQKSITVETPRAPSCSKRTSLNQTSRTMTEKGDHLDSSWMRIHRPVKSTAKKNWINNRPKSIRLSDRRLQILADKMSADFC